MTSGNKRLEGETFPDYKLRLKNEHHHIKRYLKGRKIWPGKNVGMFDTYTRKLHGEIGRKLN